MKPMPLVFQIVVWDYVEAKLYEQRTRKGFEHVGNTACIASVAGRDYIKSHDKPNKENSVTARLGESCAALSMKIRC